jgi:RNA polymerase sigma factor (TIGR02999 family)
VTTVIVVLSTAVTLPAVTSNITLVPARNPLPVIVTVVRRAVEPVDGEIAVTLGAGPAAGLGPGGDRASHAANPIAKADISTPTCMVIARLLLSRKREIGAETGSCLYPMQNVRRTGVRCTCGQNAGVSGETTIYHVSATEQTSNVTGLLREWGDGDQGALDRLIPLVHQELHQIARRCMAGERAGHSLQATALVNEAYVRLVDGKAVTWQGRAHFIAVSARVMRHILVDHARARRYQKRGGDDVRVPLDEALIVAREPALDFVALDEALQALSKFDERKSRVIEMRFFGGLSVEETATVLKVSPSTVMGDWRLAKAWLKREMRGAQSDDA